ncbi:PadR family transcriptional regulator [Clostridiaceae bacterium DONG20-135]|uniref:PadR family transcriptional regulator n=1 Tax=Copranaerobaculum intestinale TaxID=2692629 RepID=A0A6N8U5S3_9FIRM|nr:PadR family transcriptional regulator [Copranaerobaculum intestinale]MXQ73412.1 PadR family transcriptional regulator [Copranaerobaculum intestinale]
MAKRTMETLTESMLYVLMAFHTGACCGTDIAEFAERKTHGRVKIGPGTLYTILSKFVEEALILEISVDGRKRTYQITEKGRVVFQEELDRLRKCVEDGESVLL